MPWVLSACYALWFIPNTKFRKKQEEAESQIMLSQYRGRGFYDPYNQLSEMNRLFGGMSRRAGIVQGAPVAGWVPAIDVIQEGGDLVIRAELPGTKPEDVNITLQDRILTISGTRKGAVEDDDYYVQE